MLRDFDEEDRAPFIDYQRDPRYRALYDLDVGRGSDLFDLFLGWQTEVPRLQLGIFDAAGRLCGGAGLRVRPEDPAKMFEEPEARSEVNEWRVKWKHSPRQYDYAGTVVTRILNRA